MGLHEKLDILGHSGVIVSWVVGAIAMVSKVYGVHGAVQVAGKDSAWLLALHRSFKRWWVWQGAYLLMLLLFFFEPKRP